MKKTVTVNLNGRVFTMDEDAYQLLDVYLHNLRIHFGKEEEASEILADFEGRIEELFSEKLRTGSIVITLAHVEEVIARMGKPTDFADTGEVNEKTSASAAEPKATQKKLFRNMQDKKIAGVCSGIAAYFGWETIWVRLTFILLFLLGGSFSSMYIDSPQLKLQFGPTFLLIYLLAWIVIPKARTAEEKLQMRGEPITLENIGRTVAAQATPPASTNNGCLSSLLNVIAFLAKICLIGLGCLIALSFLFGFGIVIIVLFALLFGVSGGLAGRFIDVAGAVFSVHYPLLAFITFLLVTGIPLVALMYWFIARIAKLRPTNKTVKRIGVVVWLIALILFFCSGFHINNSQVSTPWGEWTISVSGENLDTGNKNIRENRRISGNDVFSEKKYVICEPIEAIRIGDHLSAKLIIEQTASDSTTLQLSGDENLIENVNYESKNGQLLLSAAHSVKRRNNLVIRIQTPTLKKFTIYSIGTASFPGTFTAETFVIELKGVGSVTMDNLLARSLEVDADGVGSVDLAGKVEHARLEADGVGKIDALQLEADTVYARLDGIGYIRCHPLKYLNAHSGGIGKISYKTEPADKDVHSSGISKIGKD